MDLDKILHAYVVQTQILRVKIWYHGPNWGEKHGFFCNSTM